MFKTIKESFKITNDFLIIATPLILFSLISNIYAIFSLNGSRLGIIFSLVLLILMLCAFLSGWFFMIMKAVKEPEMDKKESLMSEFPAGVGEYFLSILGMLFSYGVLSFVILAFAFFIGKHYIGNPNITSAQVSSALSSVAAMKDFVSSLNQEQLIKISYWNILLFAAMVINYFSILFYAPAIFFKTKNPFKGLWFALRDLFSFKFFKNIGLFLFVVITYLFISMISAFAGKNIVVYFILTLVNFYYLTYITILIFNYYYSNYAKIGSNIDKTV
jgi:hypothetical protein